MQTRLVSCYEIDGARRKLVGVSRVFCVADRHGHSKWPSYQCDLWLHFDAADFIEGS